MSCHPESARRRRRNLLIICKLDFRILTIINSRDLKLHLYYVYILTNARHNVLYTGLTNDLERRCYEHKMKKIKGFTQKYNVDKLIYYERFEYIELAIAREKQIKGYSRIKKSALIDQYNKEWNELYKNGKIGIPPFNTTNDNFL
jgi:putative endonuclease